MRDVGIVLAAQMHMRHQADDVHVFFDCVIGANFVVLRVVAGISNRASHAAVVVMTLLTGVLANFNPMMERSLVTLPLGV